MTALNSKTFGRVGEDIAADYLREKGYRIVAQNYNTYDGELDIVALKRRVLVFVEVKTVSSLAYGYPWQRITAHKKWAMRRAAAEFCKVDGSERRVPLYRGKHRYTRRYKSKRFDIIEIVAKNSAPMRITHTQNIF